MAVLSTEVLTGAATLMLATIGALYVMYFQPTRKTTPPTIYAEGDPSTAKEGHGPVYKVGKYPPMQVGTMLELLQNSARQNPKNPFLGRRPIVNGVAGSYVWDTYEEVFERVQNLAAGLLHEKMMEPSSDGQRIACVYMKNRPECLIVHYAALYAGGYISVLYDTLGTTSTVFILNQTDVQSVFTTTAEIKNIVDAKPKCPRLKNLVLCDVESLDNVDVSSATAAGLKVWTIGQVESIGSHHPVKPHYAKPTDPCFLMYTSGTTGDPKGVILTSQNLISCTQGVLERIAHGKAVETINNSAVHLSYLPLAHIFENLVVTAVITVGGRIGFYQGNTLKIAEDLAELRPTLFGTVPRLLNKIYDKIVNSAKSAGGFKGWLFNYAVETKLANLKNGYLGHPFFDKLVFSKIQQKLGLDRCKFIAVGSAPLSPEVMSFFRIALDCPLVEGYGQSECSGVSNVTDPRDYDQGNVGPPMTSTEIKLVSVPDMGYKATDTIHGEGDSSIRVKGRGEICFRGPTVFAGYYKAKDKTAEAIDEEGWLHSGDIGVWLEDGRLKIVDRKKNIFKLSQGEYVAPEKIENIVVGSEYVAQAFVYGDSLRSVLVGIIVPEEETVTILAKSLNVEGSFAEIIKNDKVVEAIHKNIVAVCKIAGLYSFEIVKAISLHGELFSVENDLLTPTFKLKRNDAKKAFMKEIDNLYAKVGDLVAGHNVKLG